MDLAFYLLLSPLKATTPRKFPHPAPLCMVVRVVHYTRCSTKRVRIEIQLALHLPSHAPTLGCDHVEEAPFSYLHKDAGGVSRGPILTNKLSGSPAPLLLP